MKKLVERELGTLTFAASQTSTLQLPRDFSYDKISLLLLANLTRAMTTPAGAARDLSGSQLISRIEVRRNGREVLKSIDFETLMRLNNIRNGAPQLRLLAGSAAAHAWDTGNANQAGIAFVLAAVLDFGMWNSVRRNDTLLDSTARGNVSTLDLVITWGTGAATMTNLYTGTVTVNSASVAISSSEYIDIDSADDKYTPYADNKEYGIRKVLTAANPKELIDLGVGNFFRSFVLRTKADQLNVNTILNNITLRSGTDVIAMRSGAGLRATNKIECSVETFPDGYYLIELCKDGHLAKMLNTTNMSSLTLELDVAVPGTENIIEVFPVEVVGAVKRVA
jgi:hypothetical protein